MSEKKPTLIKRIILMTLFLGFIIITTWGVMNQDASFTFQILGYLILSGGLLFIGYSYYHAGTVIRELINKKPNPVERWVSLIHILSSLWVATFFLLITLDIGLAEDKIKKFKTVLIDQQLFGISLPETIFYLFFAGFIFMVLTFEVKNISSLLCELFKWDSCVDNESDSQNNT